MAHSVFGPPRRRRILAPLAVAVAVVGLAAGCTGSDSHHPSAKDTSSAQAGPHESSSDGKTLKVAESGITASSDASGERLVSYAAILKNPSDDTAVATTVTVSLLDADGKPLQNTELNGKHTTWDQTVNLVPAGKRQAVTGTVYVNRAGASKLKIDIKRSRWWRGSPKKLAPVKVGHVATDPGRKGSATITYRLDSPHQNAIASASTSAVFRDSNGEILGGSDPADAKPRDYPSGRSSGEIDATSGVPKRLDASRTEVYADPAIDPS